MLRLETRSASGLIAPRSRPRLPGPVLGVTAHWNGPPLRLAGKPHSACQQALRNIQRFHMGKWYTPNPLSSGRHWADGAYTAAVCFHGVAMEIRGPKVRTAANGTTAGNDRWYAVFFMLGTGEEPTSKMLEAAEWYARSHLGTTRWNRHTDHKPTTCAGTVNKHVSGGRIRTSGAEPRDYVTVGDKGEEVRSWQRDLLKWDSKALPRFGADGDFGEETRTWTLRFTDAVGLNVSDRSAPRVGPATRQAMSDALKKAEEPMADGPFTDVPADNVHASNIERAHELGLVVGYDDGTFRPQEPITRAAAATMMVRLHDALSK